MSFIRNRITRAISILAGSIRTSQGSVLIGNPTGQAGYAQEIEIGTGLSLSGDTLSSTAETAGAAAAAQAHAIQRANHTGTQAHTTITGLGNAATANIGTTEGLIPVLGAGGKLASSLLPSIALTETLSVANAAARLALTSAQAQGKIVSEADTGKSYGLVTAGNPATSGDWLQLGDRDITAADISDSTAAGRALLTAANAAAQIAALGAETPAGATEKIVAGIKQAAFYDDFGDTRRYVDGDVVTDGVTMPAIGSVWKWKKNDGAAPADIKCKVLNGALRPVRNGGGYLAAHATPRDSQKWSIGFEFTREATRFPAAILRGCTITVGSAPLVSGSTHSAFGNWHVNFNAGGITQPGIFQAGWSAVVNTAADTLTISNPVNTSGTIETGDLVLLGGTAPGGTATGTEYWAIKVSDLVIKLATSRLNALAGTAIDLTTTGTAVTVYREMECTNRRYVNGLFPWISAGTQGRRFQGSAAANTITMDRQNFVADSAVMLEGSGLPGGLTEGTVYYLRDVINTAASATAKLALTRGGAEIDLTTDGSADQFIRGAEERQGGSAASAMPLGHRNIICVRREGDYMHFELIGVGVITFYYRGLNLVMGASGEEIGFYWQSPPEQSSSQSFLEIYALHSAWIDAPTIEEEKIRRYLSTVNTLAGTIHRLPGRLDLVAENAAIQGYGVVGANLLATMRQIIAGTGTADAGNSRRKITVGNLYVEGVYVSHLSFPDGGSGALGIAPASVNSGRDTAVSNTGTADAGLAECEACMVLETGDIEEVVICGFLTGTNAKSISVVTKFDDSFPIFNSNASGTPLNAIATPFEIRITRRQSSGLSHLTYATMHVNGTTIGPQRQSRNYSTDYKYYQIRTTCADVGAVTVETIRRTVHRVKLR